MDNPTEEPQIIARDTGLPVARELSEMMLTQIDLNNSLKSLAMWVELHQNTKDEDEGRAAMRNSLFRDGITQFVGCFDGGTNPFPLVVETVFPNIHGIAPYFRWLRQIRNAYTAHRYGAARQCIFGAIVKPETGEFLGITYIVAIYQGPSEEGHLHLLSLVTIALDYVNRRISDLTVQFIVEAKALGPDVLLSLPYAQLRTLEPTEMNLSRGDVNAAMERARGDGSA